MSRPPGLRLHPRTMPVQKARAHIHEALWRLQEEHDLTDIEMIQILLDSAQTVSKYMLRAERHPDNPECKADEADDEV